MTLDIKLIDHQEVFNADDLKNVYAPASVIACDFYVSGAEKARRVAAGYDFNGLLNVDHHAPGRRMARRVSSTNLAIRHKRRNSQHPDNGIVIISHTDCDSVLSSGIMSGHLEPDDLFRTAAIAADHTGAKNDIADLLQGIDDLPKDRKPRDPLYFIHTLKKFMQGGVDSLDDLAREGWNRRQEMREAARRAVELGDVKIENGLAVHHSNSRIDGELFIPLLPDACLIVLIRPHKNDAPRRDVKIRLGSAAPKGVTLHQLGIREFDSNFGGRWNAGSNSRNKGTQIHPDTYVANVRQRLDRLGHDLRQVME
jgi:hypothetical protein